MKILLVSHKGFASGLKKATEFILDKETSISFLELDERGIETFKNELNSLISKGLFNEKTLLLSDIPAGSPGANAYDVLVDSNVDVHYISGMNLAMVLDAYLSDSDETILNSAKESIKDFLVKDETSVNDDDF